MEEEKNKSDQPFNEDERNREKQSTEANDHSYYYSYGPFQSIGAERNQPEDVEITRPEPVKPIPASFDYRSQMASFGGGSGDSGGGGNGNERQSAGSRSGANWQYNQTPRKKSSVKSVIAGMLAGMLIMAGAMVYADKANLFTSNQATIAATTPPTAATAQGNDGSSSSKAATTASYTITNPGDVTNVVEQAGAAVVKIETLVKASKQNSGSNLPYSSDPFYRYFFGDDYYGNGGSNGGSGGNSSDSDQLVQTGIGSGFIFDKTGYILTNEHVVHNADVVQVTIQDTEKPYEAKVLGTSYELDLAVLKIEGTNDFPSIPLGNSDNTQVGEWLVAIGNPQGFDHTVTTGVLSAKERGITIAGDNGEANREYEHLLQTDASINPGNSGGPLLNLSGEVIGINVAVSSDSQGIGFAIPTSTIIEVLDKLKNNEEIPKTPVPFIGATLMTMTDEVAKQMGTDVKEGSIVSNIVFKSPAYNADLRPYDIITGADGKAFITKESLIEYIQKQEVGKEVIFNIVRDGNKMDLKITIGDKNQFNVE